MVEFFCGRVHLQNDIISSLKESQDAIRILQKLALNRGGFDDFVDLKRTLEIWNSIRLNINDDISNDADVNIGVHHMTKLLDNFADVNELTDKIASAIEENGISSQTIMESDGVDDGPETPTMDNLGDLRKDHPSRWSVKPRRVLRLIDLI